MVEDVSIGGWHLKKEVTIGQIITLITILVSGIWWASSVETRLGTSAAERTRIEQKLDITLEGMTDRFDRYQNQVSESMGRIERNLTQINDKLDKKADK